MSLSVNIGGVDRSTAYGWIVHPKSLTQGHGTWKVIWDNAAGTYTGLFSAQQVAIIGYDSVEYMRGYADVPRPVFDKSMLQRRLHLSGRDYSQDMSNQLYSASIAATAEAEDAIADMVTALGADFEITFAKPGTAATQATFGGLEPREASALEIIREIFERVDCDGYVDTAKALIMSGVGAVSTGIALTDADIIECWRDEGDGLDIRNSFRLYGERSLNLPTDLDARTETAVVNKPDKDIDAATYGTNWTNVASWSLSPTASQYAMPWNVEFDYHGENGNTSYRITINVGATGPVTVWQALGVAPGGPVTQNYAVAQEVTAHGSYAAGAAVVIAIDAKCDTSGGGEIAHCHNIDCWLENETAYWASNAGAQALEIELAVYVKGSYSVRHYEAGVNNSDFSLHWGNAPLNLKYSEYEYNELEFACYPIYSAGTFDKLVLRLYDGSGNYFYREVYGLTLNSWNNIQVQLGATAAWAENIPGAPDWNDIISLTFIFYVTGGPANMTVYIDNLFFSGKRVSYSTSNPLSIATYRTREWAEIMEDAPLADITARANSLLAKNKDTLETIYLAVPATVGIVGGVMKWIPNQSLKLNSTLMGITSATDNYRISDAEIHCFPKDARFIQHWGRSDVAFVTLVPKSVGVHAERLREIVEGPSRFYPS